MRSNTKTHRRNKAVQSFNQYQRMSYALIQSNVTPLSLRNSLQPSQDYRISNLSSFSGRSSVSKKKQNLFKNTLSKQFQSKNASTLIQSLNFLSSKVQDAKNLLQKQTKKKHKQNQAYFQVPQSQIQMLKIVMESKKKDENLESTLNIESRKLLKNNFDCKQKTIWANSLKHYYIGPFVRGMTGINDRAYEHLYQSHQLIIQHQYFNAPKIFTPLNLTCHPNDKLKKVLVIDMDQTLIHCELDFTQNCELEVEIDDGERGYISIRPYALSFLKKISKNYEIIVFTASQKDYADSILNEIDPQGLIKHRLYREHCLKINKNIYSKDLRIINRDLSQMVLVDNSAISFLCQPENGVPILPYLGGQDRELLELQKYLDVLTKQDDVRKSNRRVFNLDKYREYYSCEELVAGLYEDPKTYY